MPKQKRTLWNIEDDRRLRNLLEKRGMGIAKIAKVLKRSPKAVRRRCERLEISSSNTYIKKK
jgi:DNA-binding Lrp family transcriptional regulator